MPSERDRAWLGVDARGRLLRAGAGAAAAGGDDPALRRLVAERAWRERAAAARASAVLMVEPPLFRAYDDADPGEYGDADPGDGDGSSDEDGSGSEDGAGEAACGVSEFEDDGFEDDVEDESDASDDGAQAPEAGAIPAVLVVV